MRVTDRTLRTMLFVVEEQIAEGRMSAALTAIDILRAEVAARALTNPPTALEPGRVERLSRAERKAEGIE